MNSSPWLPLINEARCTGCGDCVAACPTGALALVDGKAALVNVPSCSYCMVCEDVCPTQAIRLPLLITFEPPDSRPAHDSGQGGPDAGPCR